MRQWTTTDAPPDIASVRRLTSVARSRSSPGTQRSAIGRRANESPWRAQHSDSCSRPNSWTSSSVRRETSRSTRALRSPTMSSSSQSPARGRGITVSRPGSTPPIQLNPCDILLQLVGWGCRRPTLRAPRSLTWPERRQGNYFFGPIATRFDLVAMYSTPSATTGVVCTVSPTSFLASTLGSLPNASTTTSPSLVPM